MPLHPLFRRLARAAKRRLFSPGAPGGPTTRGNDPFVWPPGKRAALSLTWDDARPSQLTHGLPALARHGVRGSFYVLPAAVRAHVEGWRAAVATGHEIGNHTCTHPCSGNFEFSRANALENRTLTDLESELLDANRQIADLLEVRPETFAYCCGQTFVGRGLAVKSYVPLIAQNFKVGRKFGDETCNNPAFCDLAQVLALDMDNKSFGQLLPVLLDTVRQRGWLILVGHDVGRFRDDQTTLVSTIDRLCTYAAKNDIWLDTVTAVGTHILAQQTTSRPISPSATPVA